MGGMGLFKAGFFLNFLAVRVAASMRWVLIQVRALFQINTDSNCCY